MINYIIPGFYEHFDINIKTLDLLQINKDWFYPNIKICSSFGNFQYCIFDGGRSFSEYSQASLEDIEIIAEEYNKRGVSLRFVFTNNQLKEADYYDRFCNLILETCENNLNEVVISDNGLENYIRKNYPKYKFISSTTKCLNSEKLLREEILNEKYYMVCLDYNLNKNFKMLNSLSDFEKEKCEFLVNAICAPGCPNRKEHYRLNSICSLNYGKNYQMKHCSIDQDTLHPKTMGYSNNISPKEIVNNYYQNGFKYFKIEGRTWNKPSIACTYARYFVKPEYQLEFISILLS